MTHERAVELVRIAITGIVVFLYWLDAIPVLGLWGAVGFGLYPLAKKGVSDLVYEKRVGTELFVTFATLIAIVGGESVAGAVLMVIILIAEFIADVNTDRARAAIRDLVGSVPQTAVVRRRNTEVTVPVDALQVGEIVLVKAGEKLAVDGNIVEGDGAVNESPITGESIPKDKSRGDEVFAGAILESGSIDVQVRRVGKDTTFARIVKMVEEAEESQAPVQKLADKIAAWLIPLVVVFLVIVFVVTRDVRKVVTLMVFTSPAELGLATPMVVIAAIARAAQCGILIKGGTFLEALARVQTIAFDKTGTLTIGQPAVAGIDVLVPAMTESDVLKYAAAADRRSAHPLAKAVINYAKQAEVEFPYPDDFEVLSGRGVKATVEGRLVLVGNGTLLKEQGIHEDLTTVRQGMTKVYVVKDNSILGVIYFADQIRPEAAEAIKALRRSGIEEIVMLTGDNQFAADSVAKSVGVDKSYADLLPQDKVDAIEALQLSGRKVAMIGDGINDAPALAKAYVGVAMGAGGTQAAIEAADIALMTDDLQQLVTARTIARKAYRTIQENLFFGVGVVHVLGISAALLGWIGPIQAALIHLGPDILVFVNSIKLLRVNLST